MSALKQLIRREVIGREREFVATVITNPRLKDQDQSGDGSPNWVCDLDLGGNRPAKNIPIKASGGGNRFYAQLNQTVMVRRTALGRLYVIGPGDRAIGTLTTTSYSLESGDPITAGTTGFSREPFPLEFYMGANAMKGNPSVTFSAGGGTMTRATGDFLADGLNNGTGRIGGATILNAGEVTITNVTTLVLTISTTLFDEGPLDGVTVGKIGTSRWADTLTSWPFSRLEDASGNPI
jgi:hypothetical protein